MIHAHSEVDLVSFTTSSVFVGDVMFVNVRLYLLVLQLFDVPMLVYSWFTFIVSP